MSPSSRVELQRPLSRGQSETSPGRVTFCVLATLGVDFERCKRRATPARIALVPNMPAHTRHPHRRHANARPQAVRLRRPQPPESTAHRRRPQPPPLDGPQPAALDRRHGFAARRAPARQRTLPPVQLGAPPPARERHREPTHGVSRRAVWRGGGGEGARVARAGCDRVRGRDGSIEGAHPGAGRRRRVDAQRGVRTCRRRAAAGCT